MSYNYSIILYCNEKKRRTIYRCRTLKTVRIKYSKLILEGKPLFYVDNRNKKNVEYFLGLISNNPKVKKVVYTRDQFGRNMTVKIKDHQSLLDLEPYMIEEKIYDNHSKKRITFNTLMVTLSSLSGVKMIYKLNSHIFVENDDTILFYSLKNVSDCERLINLLISERTRLGLSDCIFSRDMDTIHRKYLYEHLMNEGFSIKKLYRHFTS